MRKHWRHRLKDQIDVFLLKHFAPIPEGMHTEEHHKRVEAAYAQKK